MRFPFKTILTASALLVSMPSVQAGTEVGGFDVSGNVALTSDYMWRGTTQTNEEAAIQGGIDIGHESGVYVGTWASNVNFLEGNAVNAEDRANIEIDLYMGYKGSMDDFSYGARAAYFFYPGTTKAQDLEFEEYQLSTGYSLGDTSLNLVYDFAPDLGGADSHHVNLKVGHTLPIGLGFGAQVGRQDQDRAEAYTYYGASVSYDFAGLNASLNYSDTDLDNNQADDKVFFTLSRSF
jgi:uncharacterized protein (TIGR02001 family)